MRGIPLTCTQNLNWEAAPGQRLTLGAVALGVAVVLSGCGSGIDNASQPSTPAASTSAATSSAGEPTALLSAAELTAWETAARGFADQFNADSADAEAAFANFTEDAAILDPHNGDFRIGPKPQAVSQWAAFVEEFPGYRAQTTASYLATDSAAFPTEVRGLPPDAETLVEGGMLHELRVYRFIGDRTPTATTLELWYRLEDADALNPDSCLARRTCGNDPRSLADRYLAAWSSGNESEIAALYSADATFVDSLLAIAGSGAVEIGGLSQQRFGVDTPRACAATDVYVQSNDGDPATSDNTDPDGGKAFGVAVAYDCSLGAGSTTRTISTLSLLLLGTRPNEDVAPQLEPHGLIVSEEVLHDAASLAAAGMAR
jgi:hypothetical protein